jgi:hypothetical protein
MNFDSNIQQWITIDNQLKLHNEKIKELRDKKNILGKQLTEHAATNNLSNSTIKMGDTKLRFLNTKITEPITFKYLENTLKEIIKNENQVKILLDYIKQKRSFKEIQEIKRL